MSVFEGKKVLITGGVSGIGKIMGRMALQKGATLIILDINEKGIDETVKEFSALGKVFAFRADVSKPEDIKAVSQKVIDTVGAVDILINNAGIVIGRYFYEHSEADILRTMAINADAPMLVTLQFLPAMMNQNRGHICNIASSAGLISNPKMSVYAASKWSVIGWSDSLRLEMQQLKKNIHVTTVMPYYIDTGMFDGVKSKIPLLKPEKAAAKIIRAIEKNRIFLAMPWSINFIRFMQGILPVRFFDWLIGKQIGIYKTMEDFTGRKQL